MSNREITNNYVTKVPTHSCRAINDVIFSAVIILARGAPKGGKEVAAPPFPPKYEDSDLV
jgi:hypothetical protein